MFARKSTKALVKVFEQQKRFGGTLVKNKHVENYNNWRGDAEKRFLFDKEFFIQITVWGIIPFSAYWVLADEELRKRHALYQKRIENS
uniref:Uncharacterized protein AlNc14C11G1338 n=1 Tax=Albugo laibachii Nc14 TaxID=890382 RepID=F0W2W0_9STRA|nr:conserved hypothetical protein [Albugo laibachii Nc14]|eukprot:CCA15396.1 conserved hypothetical protein [Albugo laibachii Nc14]